MRNLHYNRKRLYLRGIALLTVIAFIGTQVVWAEGINLIPGAGGYTDSLAGADLSLPESPGGSLLTDIRIPEDVGAIKRAYQGTNGRLVVHIQEAHVNEAAQRNIAKILEYFADEHQLELVNLEGATGDLFTQFFSFFPDQTARRNIADSFLKMGRLSGPEHLAIVDRPNLRLYGVEDHDIYVENREAYLNALDRKERDGGVVEELGKALEDVGRFIYSKEFRDLELHRRAFRDGGRQLVSYSRYLVEVARSKNISIEGYYGIQQLLELVDSEQEIRFENIEDELKEFTQALERTLSGERLAEFMRRTALYQSKEMKRSDYYAYLSLELEQLPASQDESLYENVLRYLRYVQQYDNIGAGVFEEINLLERSVKNSLLRNAEEGRLDHLSEIYEVVEKMFNFALTESDIELFYAFRNEFNGKTFRQFLAPIMKRYRFSYELPSKLERIDGDLAGVERFYDAALRRDQVLVENTLAKIEANGETISALVSGGFHTPGIERALRDKGYSYVVITPRITGEIDKARESELYESALRQEHIPLEKLLVESLFPAGTSELNDPRFQLSVERTVLDLDRLLSFLNLSRRGRGAERALATYAPESLAVTLAYMIVAESIFRQRNLGGALEAMSKTARSELREEERDAVELMLERVVHAAYEDRGANGGTLYMRSPTGIAGFARFPAEDRSGARNVLGAGRTTAAMDMPLNDGAHLYAQNDIPDYLLPSGILDRLGPGTGEPALVWMDDRSKGRPVGEDEATDALIQMTEAAVTGLVERHREADAEDVLTSGELLAAKQEMIAVLRELRQGGIINDATEAFLLDRLAGIGVRAATAIVERVSAEYFRTQQEIADQKAQFHESLLYKILTAIAATTFGLTLGVGPTALTEGTLLQTVVAGISAGTFMVDMSVLVSLYVRIYLRARGVKLIEMFDRAAALEAAGAAQEPAAAEPESRMPSRPFSQTAAEIFLQVVPLIAVTGIMLGLLPALFSGNVMLTVFIELWIGLTTVSFVYLTISMVNGTPANSSPWRVNRSELRSDTNRSTLRLKLREVIPAAIAAVAVGIALWNSSPNPELGPREREEQTRAVVEKIVREEIAHALAAELPKAAEAREDQPGPLDAATVRAIVQEVLGEVGKVADKEAKKVDVVTSAPRMLRTIPATEEEKREIWGGEDPPALLNMTPNEIAARAGDYTEDQWRYLIRHHPEGKKFIETYGDFEFNVVHVMHRYMPADRQAEYEIVKPELEKLFEELKKLGLPDANEESEDYDARYFNLRDWYANFFVKVFAVHGRKDQTAAQFIAYIRQNLKTVQVGEASFRPYRKYLIDRYLSPLEWRLHERPWRDNRQDLGLALSSLRFELGWAIEHAALDVHADRFPVRYSIRTGDFGRRNFNIDIEQDRFAFLREHGLNPDARSLLMGTEKKGPFMQWRRARYRSIRANDQLGSMGSSYGAAPSYGLIRDQVRQIVLEHWKPSMLLFQPPQGIINFTNDDGFSWGEFTASGYRGSFSSTVATPGTAPREFTINKQTSVVGGTPGMPGMLTFNPDISATGHNPFTLTAVEELTSDLVFMLLQYPETWSEKDWPNLTDVSNAGKLVFLLDGLNALIAARVDDGTGNGPRVLAEHGRPDYGDWMMDVYLEGHLNASIHGTTGPNADRSLSPAGRAVVDRLAVELRDHFDNFPEEYREILQVPILRHEYLKALNESYKDPNFTSDYGSKEDAARDLDLARYELNVWGGQLIRNFVTKIALVEAADGLRDGETYAQVTERVETKTRIHAAIGVFLGHPLQIHDEFDSGRLSAMVEEVLKKRQIPEELWSALLVSLAPKPGVNGNETNKIRLQAQVLFNTITGQDIKAFDVESEEIGPLHTSLLMWWAIQAKNDADFDKWMAIVGDREKLAKVIELANRKRISYFQIPTFSVEDLLDPEAKGNYHSDVISLVEAFFKSEKEWGVWLGDEEKDLKAVEERTRGPQRSELRTVNAMALAVREVSLIRDDVLLRQMLTALLPRESSALEALIQSSVVEMAQLKFGINERVLVPSSGYYVYIYDGTKQSLERVGQLASRFETMPKGFKLLVAVSVNRNLDDRIRLKEELEQAAEENKYAANDSFKIADFEAVDWRLGNELESRSKEVGIAASEIFNITDTGASIAHTRLVDAAYLGAVPLVLRVGIVLAGEDQHIRTEYEMSIGEILATSAFAAEYLSAAA
ncbi:MAG: hypothetical protein Q8R76_01335 [Candidatus Omnitrophota bacterium]|nr:hypothetical protein [Candidatus Omnitrophota bacterium]